MLTSATAGTRRREDLLFGQSFGGNDEEVFFNHFDKKSAEATVTFIEEFHNNGLDFPELLTVYFDGVDHASHLLGLQVGPRDIQLEFLGRIDELLADILAAYRSDFPAAYEDTVFIVTADHGHETVDPDKVIVPEEILTALYSGPFNSLLKSPITNEYKFAPPAICLNGTMAQLYFLEPPEVLGRDLCRAVVGNLSEHFEVNAKNADVISRPFSFVTPQSFDYLYMTVWWEGDSIKADAWPAAAGSPEVETMLNHPKRSGDILLLARSDRGWQFAGSKRTPRTSRSRSHSSSTSTPASRLASVTRTRRPTAASGLCRCLWSSSAGRFPPRV